MFRCLLFAVFVSGHEGTEGHGTTEGREADTWEEASHPLCLVGFPDDLGNEPLIKVLEVVDAAAIDLHLRLDGVDGVHYYLGDEPGDHTGGRGGCQLVALFF